MSRSMLRRNFMPLAGALAVVILLASCGGGASGNSLGVISWPDGDKETGSRPGQRAPNFRLENAAGEAVSLDDHLGQPLLINFFASWCENCKEEMALLDEANSEEITVIGINLREGPETVERLAEETGATFPLLLDRNGKVTRAYRVTNLPVTVALDSSGIVRDFVLGPLDEDRLNDLIRAARAGGDVGGEAG